MTRITRGAAHAERLDVRQSDYDEPRARTRATHHAQQTLLSGGAIGGAFLPRQVRESWLRCQAAGVDPEAHAPLDLAALEEHRASHPLSIAMPVIRSLLVEHATDEGLLVAVTDADGLLLWVEGASAVVRRAESIHFTSGARWGEAAAGTNAPALALTLDSAVQIHSSEHWARQVQRWSCSAAPLHDPVTGQLLGALDVTGDGRAVSRGALALVKATVAAVERELMVARLRDRAEPAPTRSAPRLLTLGPAGGALELPGAAPKHLSLRHAEILLLLSRHPEGMGAEELAVHLCEHDLDTVTVRAELSRLRRVLKEAGLPDDVLATRPYRVSRSLGSDIDTVRAHLDAGRVAEALSAYTGPVLPRSEAPGVVALREALVAELRAAVLATADSSILRRWTRTPWGDEDPVAWRALGARLPDRVGQQRAAARADLVEALGR